MRATLLREPLGVEIAPPRAALALRGDDRPFALIGAWAGGGALLGSEPVRVSGPGDDLFGLLDALPAVDGVRPRWGRGRLVRVPRVRGAPPRRARPPAAAAAGPAPRRGAVLLRPPAADGPRRSVVVRGARDRRARGGDRAPPRGPARAARARPGACARSRRATGAGRRRRAATPRSSRRAGRGSARATCSRRTSACGSRAGSRATPSTSSPPPRRRCRPTAPRSSPGRGGRSRASRPSCS